MKIFQSGYSKGKYGCTEHCIFKRRSLHKDTKGVTAEKPVQILNFSTGSDEKLMLQPRNLVILEEGAEVEVIERHQSLTENEVLTNSVTEIFLEKMLN